MSPDLFSGLSSWSKRIDHFEATALVDGWDNEKKTAVDSGAASWESADSVEAVSAETRESYAATKEKLQNQFEPDSKQKLYFVEFRVKRLSTAWYFPGRMLQLWTERPQILRVQEAIPFQHLLRLWTRSNSWHLTWTRTF